MACLNLSESSTPIDHVSRTAPAFRDSIFRAVFEDARMGIAGALLDGRFIVSNAAFQRALGVTACELVQSRLEDWTEPEDWQKESQLINALLSRTIDRYELTKRCRANDGSRFWANVTVTITENDPPLLIILSERLDASRNREQEALRQSEMNVRAIFENSIDGIILLDDEGRYVDVNPAACTLFLRNREDVIGTTFGSMSQEPEKTLDAWELVRRNGFASAEITVLRGDGSTRIVEFTMTGNILPGLTLGISRDITERKELEQKLLHAQKMEAIGRLAGGVAHDINNMLTVIRGYAELMRKKLPADHPLGRYTDNILAAADRSSMITQQLLAFSRRQVVKMQRIRPNQVIADVSKLLQRLIGEDIELEVQLDNRCGSVIADPGQLGQVLMNLAVNARDAMPHGGKLMISTESKTVTNCYVSPKLRPGEYVAIHVTDTGHGMTPEVIAHIFEPFFTTKEQGKGTGLGLATVYGIVEQSGGALDVKSAPGEGTTFSVYLPVAAEPTTGTQA